MPVFLTEPPRTDFSTLFVGQLAEVTNGFDVVELLELTQPYVSPELLGRLQEVQKQDPAEKARFWNEQMVMAYRRQEFELMDLARKLASAFAHVARQNKARKQAEQQRVYALWELLSLDAQPYELPTRLYTDPGLDAKFKDYKPMELFVLRIGKLAGVLETPFVKCWFQMKDGKDTGAYVRIDLLAKDGACMTGVTEDGKWIEDPEAWLIKNSGLDQAYAL